jgi:hypothetical protein
MGAAASAVGIDDLLVDPIEKKKTKAKDAIRDQKLQAARLEKDLADRQSNEASRNTSSRRRARQRAFSAGGQGRSSTILTSPLGTPSNPSGEQKTALGA